MFKKPKIELNSKKYNRTLEECALQFCDFEKAEKTHSFARQFGTTYNCHQNKQKILNKYNRKFKQGNVEMLTGFYIRVK